MRVRRDRDITNLRLRHDCPSPPVKPAKDNGVVALFLLLTWLSFATPIVVLFTLGLDLSYLTYGERLVLAFSYLIGPIILSMGIMKFPIAIYQR